MTEWYHHFWHMIILAGILTGFMAFGGALALITWVIRETVKDWTNASVGSETFLYKINLTIFEFCSGCLRFYKKSAQWIGSIIITLLIVGIVGRFAIFALTHWREIWGP